MCDDAIQLLVSEIKEHEQTIWRVIVCMRCVCMCVSVCVYVCGCVCVCG